jgi:thioesterase domain-containing protein
VLRHQTVASLAAAVGEAGSSLLIDLSENADGQTLFCIHPGGGSVHWYGQLAAELAGTHRLVGVQAAGMEPDEKPCTSIPEMAARYWTEIRAVQPDGPYRLLGWSLGAVVAHEMARLHPGDVEVVYLLEPPLVESGVRTRLLSYVDQYRRAAELWQYSRTVSEGREEILRELRKVAEPLEVDDQDVTVEDWMPFETLGLLLESVVNHVPVYSQASSVLVISDTVSQASNHSDGDAQHYIDSWAALYPGAVPVVRLTGDHMDMVTSPEALAQLAAELRR